MSLFHRLFGRRDAMDQWRSGMERHPAPHAAGHRRAPDADREDVVYSPPVGFDGRPIQATRGGITGLESGGSPNVPSFYKN